MARLWLQVSYYHPGPGYGHPSELWWRDMPLEGTPVPGEDQIMVLATDDEPYGSMPHDIKRRYWDHTGRLNFEMRGFVYLPNNVYEDDLSAGIGRYSRDNATYYRHFPSPWRHEDDQYGTIEECLVASGWHRWAELRESAEEAPAPT